MTTHLIANQHQVKNEEFHSANFRHRWLIE
jgi:hypothetical protein